MTDATLITIVVPSFNQAQFIGETLQSLVDQEYPNLQVVIQDGGSKDGSLAVAEDFAERHPGIFELYVEKDNGQADAINRGFAKAKGEILAFLNSDDTYYPHVLHRVAAELDPARGRHVVMGRCLFTGENSRYVGVEHPAEYLSHFEHLAVWKRGFNTIPQPSVFWTRSVWERCGGLDVNEYHALDYDLFCRFSRHFYIHRVDELWSTYRMHGLSKSAQRTEAEVLDLTILVSRKYWGSWLTPLRWRCELSYAWHKRHTHELARHHARRAEHAFREGQLGRALVEFLHTVRFSPRMARDRLFYGWLEAKNVRFFQKLICLPECFTGRHGDFWIGPLYRENYSVPEQAERLVVTLTHHPQPGHKNVTVQLVINGILHGTITVAEGTTFTLIAGIESFRDQSIVVEVKTDSYFVPSDVFGGEDHRQLSMTLCGIHFEPQMEGSNESDAA